MVELQIDEYRYDEDLSCWVLVEEPTLTDDRRRLLDIHSHRTSSGWQLVTSTQSPDGLVREVWSRS